MPVDYVERDRNIFLTIRHLRPDFADNGMKTFQPKLQYILGLSKLLQLAMSNCIFFSAPSFVTSKN